MNVVRDPATIATHTERKSSRDSWSRKGRIVGDIVNLDMAVLWWGGPPGLPSSA